MEYTTVGKIYNKGKTAYIKCVKNDTLEKIDINNKCFLLIILSSGKLEFSVSNKYVAAIAPSFLCFNETENPVLISKTSAKYTCIYFHPNFLNVNMNFEVLRTKKYSDIATTHDMFLLKPFINRDYVIPIIDTQVERIQRSADYMNDELYLQRDWYWSCRGRSYFMEIIIVLERMYGLMGYGGTYQTKDNAAVILNPKLRDAVLFIESHYSENIMLSDISLNAGINHTTLTALMKEEIGCTVIEYLIKYRIAVSKKQLAFTEIPIKEIAYMVGFKTVQHFNRTFKKYAGMPPAQFRKLAVENRKENFKK